MKKEKRAALFSTHYGKSKKCRILEKPRKIAVKFFKKTGCFVDNFGGFWWTTWITYEKSLFFGVLHVDNLCNLVPQIIYYVNLQNMCNLF